MGKRSSGSGGRKRTNLQLERLSRLRPAESRGEALTEYAKRRGLSVGLLYEPKRRLRQVGVIQTAKAEDAARLDGERGKG